MAIMGTEHPLGKNVTATNGCLSDTSTEAAHSTHAALIESWVDEHAGYLFRYALPRVRDHHAVEELVQETFLAAMKGLDAFQSTSSPRTWLVGILRHKIMDFFRKLDRKKETESLDVSDSKIDSWFDKRGRWITAPGQIEVDPVALGERADFWVVFERCLHELPELQAEAFSLRVMDDVDSEKVCKVLSVSSTNLWVLLHRARARLRACLEANWFDLSCPEKP